MAYDGEKDHVLIKKLQEELREECGRDTEQIIKDVKSKQDSFNTEVSKTIRIISICVPILLQIQILFMFEV